LPAYLKCSERTVRRWEQEGLPVHPHKSKAAIYAYKAEIDAWWRNGHERLKQIEELPEEPPPKALVRWHRRTWLAAGTVLAAAFVMVLPN
jgi:phage terminase Nu1 subunit (DNA packaging protein)